MRLNEDFEDLLLHLNAVRARYLIVGAYAVIYHTEPRYTKDLDIGIDPAPENAQKVYEALRRFGAPVKDLTLEDLTNPKMVYQIGIEPNRIDILMGIGPVPFEQAWKRSEVSHYGRAKVRFLGMEDLITAKRTAGRRRDQADLDTLRQKKKMIGQAIQGVPVMRERATRVTRGTNPKACESR